MKLLYKEDRFFIGVIKFFDASKDFGFIASNNCNMALSGYNQDFYVNSSSFIEEDAKKDGRVVVFQVEKQEKGRIRAVNVRKISKSDEDIQLALSYYGDHECVSYKNGIKVNLLNNISVPRRCVVDLVCSIIKADKDRSPQTTLAHFQFFVKHYKEDIYSSDKYIFDKDFAREEKSLWVSLFSIFTNEEYLEVLKVYPSVCRYIIRGELINEWLNAIITDECSLSKLQEIKKCINYIPDEYFGAAQSKLEEVIDNRLKQIFDDFAHNLNVEIWQVEDKIRPYLQMTTNKYEAEKSHCIAAIKYNRFKQALDKYVAKPSENYAMDPLFKSFEALENEKEKHVDELKLAITPVLEQFITDKRYYNVISLLNKLSCIGDSFITSYRNVLFPLVKDYLCEEAKSNLNNVYKIEMDFFFAYHQLTSLFSEEEKELIKLEILPIMMETTSIYVLSFITVKVTGWLTMDLALSLASKMIALWKYSDLEEFVENEPYLFNGDERFVDIIVSRAIQLVGEFKLSEFFDGTPKEDDPRKYLYYRNPEIENCTFLNNVRKLFSNNIQNAKWDTYIQSRETDDLLILYDNEVITTLPLSVIKDIVGRISLESVYSQHFRWYDKPTLQNALYKKVLENTSVDIFTLIANRLSSMELSDNNIPLAVLLTELMTINRPDGSDYSLLRSWENVFNSKLSNFRDAQINNTRLTVILWAVYFQTKTSMSTFSEIFAYLPPYVQIRCVKKLFQLIALGKVQHTVKSLYNLLSTSIAPMCFPLEIVFAYLKLREKDPTATLTNNVMLQLLDGRDDYNEWIGIRELVTQCRGRWKVDEEDDSRTNWKRGSYFNGMIEESTDHKIKVFVAPKMIDEHGYIKEYNNKYYNQISELISITFPDDEYQVVNETQGKSYYINESHEIELFNLARAYNLKYKHVSNSIDFSVNWEDGDTFCECRLSDKVDNYHGISFYWCKNKPCFRPPLRYRVTSEWQYYTMLDFMRILKIPTDYVNRFGKKTKFGYYIILSSYLKSFAKFYEHLKCRKCGKLMKPTNISNYATRAVNEFACSDEQCDGFGETVYLNHCFNKSKCNATIDSRDSKTCPNGLYICPECGACCSTENFKLRQSNLHATGGVISPWLINFVNNNMGHWEKHEFFCFKCGKPIMMSENIYKCTECGTEYVH